MNLPTHRSSSHPGAVLREEFLEPAGITVTGLAAVLCIKRRRLSQIVNEKRGISRDTATRLAAHYQTTVEFWLNLDAAFKKSAARR